MLEMCLIIFIVGLFALAVIDIRTGYLPDYLTVPLLLLGLMVNMANGFVPWLDAVVGAVIGFACLWVLDKLYRLIRGRSGLGLGDAKLLAALGAWFGWHSLPYIVLVSAGVTLVGAVIKMAITSSHRHVVPYGPGLAFAGIVYCAFCSCCTIFNTIHLGVPCQ